MFLSSAFISIAIAEDNISQNSKAGFEEWNDDKLQMLNEHNRQWRDMQYENRRQEADRADKATNGEKTSVPEKDRDGEPEKSFPFMDPRLKYRDPFECGC